MQSDSDLLNRLRAEAKEQARISADQEIEKESVDQVFQPAEDKKIWPDKLSIGEMDYIRIPKGKFVIGDSGEEHEVDILYDYWLARFEVTNEQFKKFVDDNNFVEPWSVINWEKKLDHPVVNISWYSTKAYCRWLHQKYYSEELPTDWVFRLPTEAEWEKAARGTKGRAWPWGNVFDKSRCNSATNIAVGLISFLDSNNTTPVGKYTPRGDSPFGIADMAGNVWEWTHSLYKEYPYRIDDGREIEDAKGNRVRRGGSFSSIAADVRTFSRFRGYPSLKDANGGFRVALAPKLQ